MNQDDGRDAESLKGFYAYKNTFDKDSVWVKVPRRVTFIINADPDADLDLEYMGIGTTHPSDSRYTQTINNPTWNQAAQSSSNTNDLDTHSKIASGDSHQFDPSTIASQASTSREPSAAEEALQALDSTPHRALASSMTPAETQPPSLNHILNSSSVMSPPLEVKIDQSSGSNPSTDSQIIQNVDVERTHEMSFLLRHFAEVPGHFMDLFDRESYFSLCVPVKAITNPLLRHAAAAYAAKQLTKVRGRKAVHNGAATKQAYMEVYPNSTSINWVYKAAQHYDKAISLLMDSIKDDGSGSARAEPDAAEGWTAPVPFGVDEFGRGEKRKPPCDIATPISLTSTDSHSIANPKKKRKVSAGQVLSDEMAAAAVMLCDYEFLEAPGSAWSKHLSGTKSLLDIVETSMQPIHATQMVPRPGFSRAKQATFWDFARQDYLAAFINETQTRLDTEDLPLWREAGLLIDEEGFVQPSNTTASGHVEENSGVMKADMISNALVWLGSKIVNYAVAVENGPGGSQEAWEGMNRTTMQLRWNELQKQLDVWHTGLPDTFEPCVELDPLELPSHHGVSDAVFPEVWFNDMMAASTMQHYHMAQMLLKIHKPQHLVRGREPFYKRLGSFKSTARDVEHHARAICGIAASRPAASVRVHSVQPLYLAGQCLERPAERTELIRILGAIETDTGWAAEYRIQQLLRLWSDTSQPVNNAS
ncbi:MAG: hypothetical protein M1828_006755 [Chrysothrix sp. TS-e1954]|nr:MAG: hypothetical protein M1828_006755 [Chrysothrix sp. TS-e1954]